MTDETKNTLGSVAAGAVGGLIVLGVAKAISWGKKKHAEKKASKAETQQTPEVEIPKEVKKKPVKKGSGTSQSDTQTEESE